MGLNLGPPPTTDQITSAPQSVETNDNPHVAYCTVCGRRFNVDEFNRCGAYGNTTVCWHPCAGEVRFL